MELGDHIKNIILNIFIFFHFINKNIIIIINKTENSGFYILPSLKEFGPQILTFKNRRVLDIDSAYHLQVPMLLLHISGFSTKL